MNFPVILILSLVLCPILLGQNSEQPKPGSQAAIPSPPGQTSSAPKGFMLEDGTPVKLRINRTISSSDAHVGDTVDFEVLEDVHVNGVLVIPKEGLAFATVTEAQSKRRMARGGKLDINIDNVKLTSGEKAALRAVKEVKGGGHTGAMTGGIVATSLVFFPAAPFFLFMHGKDISIPKGTEITAYISGDMKLDLAKFQGTQPTSAGLSGATVATEQAHVQVSSVPDAADIEIDGSYVGSTPSNVGVSAGQHQLAVKKSGFTSWERKITVSSGQINVNAVLEKESK
jgi:hypothetical protein